VIGHVLGARGVGVVTNGAGSGETIIGYTEPWISVHIRVARFPAELRFCEIVGDCPADRHPVHSTHDDNERACASAQEACREDIATASAILAEARDTVRTMVAQEWPRIERVALAVYNSPDGILKSRPVAELLDGLGAPSG